MRRPTIALALVASIALALAGCAPSSQEAKAQKSSGTDTFTVATTTDVVNYNPLLGSSRTDSWVTDLMYPRLLNIGKDGTKEAGLATKWGYVNPTTGYYDLRDDMKWSDGKPVTASDVAFTINAVKRDKPAGVIYGQMTNLDSAKAVSPTRVELTLSRPDATVVPEIGFWMPVVPEQVFGKAGSVATFANNSDWVSAGPYRLTKAAKGQSYTFERVTPYPFAPNNTPTMSKIVFRVFPDVNTEILALKNGDVDLIANALPPAQVDNLKKANGIKVEEVPGLGYAHMTYNMDHQPLDKLEVREALAHAVDYDAIRKVVLQGQAVTTGSSPIPPVLTKWADPSLTEYSYDPQQSRKLLEQAGFKADSSGNFPLSLTLIYSLQDAVTAQWVTLVKDGAAKAGITIQLKGMDRNTYLQAADTGDFDIYAGNFAIMDDPPTNMTLTYLPKGAINFSHVDVPQLSQLITEAQASIDQSKQIDLIHQASKMVHDNVYDNVMYQQNLYLAHKDSWTGFVVQPSELLSIVNPQSLANVRPAS